MRKASALLLSVSLTILPMTGYSSSGDIIPVMSSTYYGQLPYDGKREVYRSAIKSVLIQIKQDSALSNTYRNAATRALGEVSKELQPVDIYGYDASNSFFLPSSQGSKTGLIVILNSSDPKPYIVINNQSALGLLNTTTFKDNFSSYNLSNGTSYSGVSTALNGFANNNSGGWTSYYFNYNNAEKLNTFKMADQLINRLAANTVNESNRDQILAQVLKYPLKRSALGEYIPSTDVLREDHLTYVLNGKDVSLVKLHTDNNKGLNTILPSEFDVNNTTNDWLSDTSIELWKDFYADAKTNYDGSIQVFLRYPEDSYLLSYRAYATPLLSSKHGYGYKMQDGLLPEKNYYIFANSIGQVSIFKPKYTTVNGQTINTLETIYTQIPEFIPPTNSFYEDVPGFNLTGTAIVPYPFAPLIITSQILNSGESGHLNSLVNTVNILIAASNLAIPFDSDVGPVWGDDFAASLETTPSNIKLQTKYNLGGSITYPGSPISATQNFVNALRITVPHTGPDGLAVIGLSVLDSSAAGIDADIASAEHSADELFEVTLTWDENQERFVLPRIGGYLDKNKLKFTHRSTAGVSATTQKVPVTSWLSVTREAVASVLTSISWKLTNTEVSKAAYSLSIVSKVPLIGHIATAIALAANTGDEVVNNATSTGYEISVGVSTSTTGALGMKQLKLSAGASAVIQVLYD